MFKDTKNKFSRILVVIMSFCLIILASGIFGHWAFMFKVSDFNELRIDSLEEVSIKSDDNKIYFDDGEIEKIINEITNLPSYASVGSINKPLYKENSCILEFIIKGEHAPYRMVLFKSDDGKSPDRVSMERGWDFHTWYYKVYNGTHLREIVNSFVGGVC